MNESTIARSSSRAEQLSALARPRRRYVLAVLVDEGETTVPRLAAGVLAHESGDGDVTPDDEAYESVLIDLEHTHLPALDEANLVDYHPEERTVEVTDHPVYEDDRFERVLSSPEDAWDEVLECLADEERRQILSIVATRTRNTSRDAIARELDARLSDRNPSTLSSRDRLTSLHHVHLPKLAEADLIDYDVDDGTVNYQGHPDLGESMFDM